MYHIPLFVHTDNKRDKKGKKTAKRCLITNPSSATKKAKTDYDDGFDDEAYEKFIQGSNAGTKSENSRWNEVHIELRKKLEKSGTLNRFGVVHLSLWTDLIIEGTVSGSDEEPDWSKYRHITSVDPLPKRGAGLSTPRMVPSSSQEMIAALMLQQEARRDEERKQESERRREQERKWQEIERQNREQHFKGSFAMHAICEPTIRCRHHLA